MNKIILDLCGGTGSWSRPWALNGYDVRIITLPEHDVRDYHPPENVWGIFTASPCTEFSVLNYIAENRERDFDAGKGGNIVIKLYNGDCLQLLQEISDKSIDICFTSPPYNRKRNDKYANYNDTKENYYEFLLKVIESLRLKVKKHIFLNIQTNYYNKQDVYRLIGTYADYIQQIFIWEKSNPLPASGNSITNAFEYFIVIGEKPLKSNRTYVKNHLTTSVNSDTTTKIHKAVMKQEVSDWFIERFTNKEDIVIDPFMGLGTTGISCVKNKCDFIGIELDEQYFNIAKQRIEQSNNKFV